MTDDGLPLEEAGMAHWMDVRSLRIHDTNELQKMGVCMVAHQVYLLKKRYADRAAGLKAAARYDTEDLQASRDIGFQISSLLKSYAIE